MISRCARIFPDRHDIVWNAKIMSKFPSREKQRKKFHFFAYFPIIQPDYHTMSSSDLAPLIHTLFSGIGIQIDHLDISEDHNSVEIVLKTPDSPILIGIHGKNMDALRHVLSRMIERHRQKFLHVHIEVNDYMKAKDERLFRFLDKKVALLRATGGRVALPDLNAFERKKAHNYIAELKISGLTSVSE